MLLSSVSHVGSLVVLVVITDALEKEASTKRRRGVCVCMCQRRFLMIIVATMNIVDAFLCTSIETDVVTVIINVVAKSTVSRVSHTHENTIFSTIRSNA